MIIYRLSRILPIALMGLTFLASPGALARTSEDLEATIRSAITQLHPVDTPQWWHDLGPQAPGVIISMAERSDSTYERTRLVGALAWYPEDAHAVDFLKEQVDQAPDEVTRTKAITALGASQGPKELEFISRHLQNADPSMRVAAARALSKMDDPKAKQRLTQFLAAEKDPGVAQAAQGVHPQAHPLKPVSSNEDRINPEFQGTWSGFWVAPRKEGGMTSLPVKLRLKIVDSKQLTAELQVAQAKGPVKLTDIHARGSRIAGTLTAPLPAAGFSGALLHQAGVSLLELPAPIAGGILVLRKDAR
jgi:hypothetical protein